MFVLYLKRKEQITIYKQHHENNILSVLKTLYCKRIPYDTLKTSSSLLFNKLAEVALAISNILRKHYAKI